MPMIMSTTRFRTKQERGLLEGIWKYSKELDTVLPAKHMRMLYDTFKLDEGEHIDTASEGDVIAERLPATE
jgi:hypothetical protein